MKSILVLGGTGAMGNHLVQILADRGCKVSVTTRSPRQPFANVEYVHGNAKDDYFLDSLLSSKWDAIVDFMVYTTAVFKQRASKFLAATDQYIFLSSSRVYADSDLPINEESPRLLDNTRDLEFLETDEYSLAKARQEDILHHSGSKNWTIIRPYVTYSEQRLQLGVFEKEDWLYRALRGRTIVFSEDIASKLTTMTYGLEVASAIAVLIGERRALGEVYHVTQRDSHTWMEILNIYCAVLEKHLGSPPKILLLGLDDFSLCKSAEYQIKYDRLFNRVFDNSKIAEVTDMREFKTVEQGLASCLKEFLGTPAFLAINWRSEAVRDRFSGEVASLKEIRHWKQKIKYLLYRFIKT